MAGNKLEDPFQLFPKEVWEIICDQMEDSKDIVSLLHSFPKLDVSIDKQKRIWLIDQVLPFLVEYINWESVSNLRLVCKQWQRRVDSFLQNQPLYRAYYHELHQDYFNFWNFLNPLESNGFESHLILKRETANSLISTILSERLQSLRNPFIFRKLQFQFENELNSSRLNEEFLSEIFELLERFGSHLWYVEINTVYSPQILEVINLPGGILQNIVRILEHTPNLKSLILTGFKQDLEELTSPGYPPIKESMLPKLPYLETFMLTGDTDVFPDNFIQILLNCYGSQIRRLEMPLSRWKMEEFKNLFPTLTELELEDSDEDIPKLIEILMTLSAPNLAALTLPFGDSKPIYLKISDILQWLQRFPKIKYLSICPQNQSESKITLEEKEIVDHTFIIPSLQTLRIMDGLDLSYIFLNSFPSLKILEILFGFKPVVVDLSMPDSVVKIREHIQTGKMYHSNIWKLLGKLRTVTLTAQLDDYDDYQWHFKFNRDTYEKIEKIEEISLNSPVQHPVRRDVWDFLRSSAGEDVLFNLNDNDDENSSGSSCSAEEAPERAGSSEDESTSDDDE